MMYDSTEKVCNRAAAAYQHLIAKGKVDPESAGRIVAVMIEKGWV